jgi:hypothetical protein
MNDQNKKIKLQKLSEALRDNLKRRKKTSETSEKNKNDKKIKNEK